ncbi:MAG: S8 family serine peptidase, partial [Bacteroidota bacterium]
MKRLTAALLPALVLLVALNAAAASRPTSYSMPVGVTARDYMPGTILLRVDPAYRNLCTERSISIPAFEQACKTLGAVQLRKVFPTHQPPATPFNEQGKALVDLSLIYELKLAADRSLVKSINALLASGVLLYAEPKFIPRTQYNPNDPSTGLQSFLSKISAYDAWDIHKGDTNTVIGITDTGTDLDHPDLQPNMKLNYADPVDGTDNDGDGFTDNYRGWDLGENDNNPEVNASAHGSHVTGCAAAVTDNNTGVASPGFYCKFLPIKISDNTGALTQAYEGIVYAADHGCQIINCSWGSVGGGGTFGQNIVDYATFNKNSLVIAAAGNNGANQEFYPAAYANVIAVASTGNT